MKETKTEKIMSARRYAESLRRAKAFLDAYEDVKNRNTPESMGQFTGDDFLIFSVDSCITAIESFINHVGFIFYDDWEMYEKKGFYDQYKKVIKRLEELEVNASNFQKEPYPGFKKYRESIRNPLHHVRTSKDDVKMPITNDTLSYNDEFSESSSMLVPYITISYGMAEDSFLKTTNFIRQVCSEFEKNHFHCNELKNILFPFKKNKDLRYKERETLIRRLVGDPFNQLPLVSGKTTLSNQ